MNKKIAILLFLIAAMLVPTGCLSKDPVTQPIVTQPTQVINLLPDGSIITGDMPIIYQTDPSAVPSDTVPEPTTAITTDWIIDIYNNVYNTTKADPSFVGTDEILISDITVDGIKNSGVDSIVYSVLDTIYEQQTLPLPPYSDTNPFPTCIFTAEDAAHAEWTDLGNGTAAIRIVPKASINSHLGEGQGKMFNVINDIRPIFEQLPAFTYDWSEGDTDSNVTVTYDGGYCEVNYDRTTMKMNSAKYVMQLDIAIKNIEILFATHNVSVKMTYTQTFPAA
ncbi:MAG: hypothetical protein IJO14_07640 [Clostridia bacterium]|nr:hypothetical protein [Clostridia bacterium]